MKKNKAMLSLALAGLLILILADGFFIYRMIGGYQEKIQILSVMAEEQGKNNVDTAVSLLKGTQDSHGEAGRRVLADYGYLSPPINQYSMRLKKDILCTLWLYLAMFALYLLAARSILKQLEEKKGQELQELERTLDQFRKRAYALDVETSGQDGNAAMVRIYEQLRLIGEMLELGQEKLTEEKEAMKSLVTDISHQLKTPIAGLRTCFEILSREDLNAQERAQFQEQCSRQLKGLEAMTGDLVNISRMEAGMIQIKKEPADILETLIAAVNRVYLKAEEKQISIEFQETEDFGSLKLPHDVKWVCEAFINILENAIKYSPSHTVISICMVKCINFLRIEIKDQGIGIPKEEYHKIFKRFYRGSAQEIEQTEGSGVGLYLTREILGNHGGSITVSSQCHGSGRGSTFVVQLPLKE